MQKFARFGVFLLIFVCISGYAIAKPAPPLELMEMLKEFSEIEEKFEHGEWKSARESLSEISENYSVVYKQHQAAISGKLDKHFLRCCDKFKMNLVVQDEEHARKSFVSLRLVLFDIMDQFNYEVHPVIALMQKFIGDEAKEALEEDNYKEVQSEIEEVYAFFRQSRPMLKMNGVGEEAIGSFQKTMGKAMRLAKKEDKQVLESTLNQLEDQLVVFQQALQ